MKEQIRKQKSESGNRTTAASGALRRAEEVGGQWAKHLTQTPHPAFGHLLPIAEKGISPERRGIGAQVTRCEGAPEGVLVEKAKGQRLKAKGTASTESRRAVEICDQIPKGALLYTKSQMAALLQVSMRCLNEMMANGQISYLKIGGKLVRFRAAHVLRRLRETSFVCKGEELNAEERRDFCPQITQSAQTGNPK